MNSFTLRLAKLFSEFLKYYILTHDVKAAHNYNYYKNVVDIKRRLDDMLDGGAHAKDTKED